MQIPEMRIYRTLHSPKHLLTLIKQNHNNLSLSTKSHQIHQKSIHTATQFHRNFTRSYTSNSISQLNDDSKNKKKSSKAVWLCSDCGQSSAKWYGACNNCGGQLTNITGTSASNRPQNPRIENQVQNPRVVTAYDPLTKELATRSIEQDEDDDSGKTVNLPGFGLFVEGSVLERSGFGLGVKKKSEDEVKVRTLQAPISWSETLRSGGREGEDEGGKIVDLSGLGSFLEGSLEERSVGSGKKESKEVNLSSRAGEEDSSSSSGSISDCKPGWSVGEFVSKKNTGKSSKVAWVCSNCGESFLQWFGICRHCKAGELKQFTESENVESKMKGGIDEREKVGGTGIWFQQKGGGSYPQRLSDVNKGVNQSAWRIPLSGLFGAEVARVLGGGLVPGSLVLVGGDPGVGKSTMLLQIAAMIAEGRDFGRPAPVLYVSGEESLEQIGNRADRMRIGTNDLFLYSSTDIEDILEKIQILSPGALIVDSIQTVYLKGVTGSAGGIMQVKECTSSLLRFAKKTNIPVLLIGHVNKTGDIAGPRVLEHIVDAVLYMEGEKYSAYRFLRSVKNRFGSTDELGVFEMSQHGLQAVANPSDIFLSEQHSDSEVLAGLAVAVVIDGSRTFLIEVQALCLPDSSFSKQYNGVGQSRAEMIIAILIKQAGLKLQNNAIFINVVSGVKLKETAGDLAIAAAVCSSFLEFPIPNNIAFIGEIGLGGELRPVCIFLVPRMEKRVNAVAKLGYKKCIVPKSAEKPLAALDLNGMTILGCMNLKEVINNVFRS